MKNHISFPGIILFLMLTLLPCLAAAQFPGINIDAGAQITTIGSSTIIITEGSFRNNGTLNTSEDNTLSFNGSLPQTIEGASSSIFNDLIVLNTGGVVMSGGEKSVRRVLLCNGPLHTNGLLTLLSTESGTALIDGTGTAPVSGEVTMQRYLPSGFGYKYFSSPFTAATVSEFGDDMDLASSFPLFYRYDESRTSSGWVACSTGTALLNPLEGYAVNFGASGLPGTVDVTGEVNNGSLSVTLYNHDNTYTKGFNLVGNPYPSPVDWNKIRLLSTNVDDAVYYFRASTTDAFAGSYSTFINGISSDGVASNIIASMQAFFIHVTDGEWPVEGTLAMNNSVRVNTPNSVFLKSSATTQLNLIRISASFSDNPDLADPTVIYFDHQATQDFDGRFDALKLMNTDSRIPSLYSESGNGNKLSINSLPPFSTGTLEVPLGIRTDMPGTVVFRLQAVDMALMLTDIYLYDTAVNKRQAMMQNGEYSVTLPAGEHSNRFYLSFSYSLTDMLGPLIPDLDSFAAWHSGGVTTVVVKKTLRGRGSLLIHNLSGQILFEKQIHESGRYDLHTDLSSGIYIVTYKSGTLKSSMKIVVMN